MLTGYLSVVFNTKGPHYTALKQAIQRQYEDSWYWEDAAVMERNIRNFVFRVQRRNENAEALCDLRSAHPRGNFPPMTSSFISSSCLIYGIGQSARCITPKSSTTKHFYEAFLRRGGGRGFLRSVYFHDPIDCTVFLDAVDTLKGP
jgi:cystathionine gamma-synthase